MPKSKAYFYREDSEQRLKNPIITFQIVHRKIKDKTSKSPQLKESGFEGDDDRTFTIYTTSYSSIVRFQFLALEYDTAFKMMDDFEDMMDEYKGLIRSKGIVAGRITGSFFFSLKLSFMSTVSYFRFSTMSSAIGCNLASV